MATYISRADNHQNIFETVMCLFQHRIFAANKVPAPKHWHLHMVLLLLSPTETFLTIILRNNPLWNFFPLNKNVNLAKALADNSLNVTHIII